MRNQSDFTVLDLFCGAGGLSLGFHQAGFNIVQAVDNNPTALETYRFNFGSHVTSLDLSQDAEFSPVSVVIGGPPCQGFSSAGLRKPGDERNSLVSSFTRTITELRPKAFVFENVEGFLTTEKGDRVMELLVPLIQAGYHIHLRKINAANYGVPQHRKRVIAVGGLGWDPTFPKPTHSAFGAPGAELASTILEPTPTVTDSIGDLPSPRTQPPGFPQGHYYTPLKGLDLARATKLRPGQTMRDLPAELQHSSYKRRANRRVMDGTPTERRGGPPSGVRRLRPDEPSKAITGGAANEFLHPYEDRNLTIRECARLQTFPDDFVFFGSKSQQHQLIGNAVPPLLARIFAETLLIDLTMQFSTEKSTGDGSLLSFVPTLSEGYSPALKQITERVKSYFLHKTEVYTIPLWG